MDDLKNILESLLFVADEPLNINRFKKIIPEVDTRQIREAMAALSTEYDARKTSFYLIEVAGGYQLRTRPAYTEWIRRLVQPKPARMSKAALETLAIVAYKQPVLRADIEHIRGVDSGGTLRLLLERNLIRILGRKEIPGRPLIYATTKLFLEVFGLKDLKELPTPKEIESLGPDGDTAADLDGMEQDRTDESRLSEPARDVDGQTEPAPLSEPPSAETDPPHPPTDSSEPPDEKGLDDGTLGDYKATEHPNKGG